MTDLDELFLQLQDSKTIDEAEAFINEQNTPEFAVAVFEWLQEQLSSCASGDSGALLGLVVLKNHLTKYIRSWIKEYGVDVIVDFLEGIVPTYFEIEEDNNDNFLDNYANMMVEVFYYLFPTNYNFLELFAEALGDTDCQNTTHMLHLLHQTMKKFGGNRLSKARVLFREFCEEHTENIMSVIDNFFEDKKMVALSTLKTFVVEYITMFNSSMLKSFIPYAKHLLQEVYVATPSLVNLIMDYVSVLATYSYELSLEEITDLFNAILDSIFVFSRERNISECGYEEIFFIVISVDCILKLSEYNSSIVKNMDDETLDSLYHVCYSLTKLSTHELSRWIEDPEECAADFLMESMENSARQAALRLIHEFYTLQPKGFISDVLTLEAFDDINDEIAFATAAIVCKMNDYGSMLNVYNWIESMESTSINDFSMLLLGEYIATHNGIDESIMVTIVEHAFSLLLSDDLVVCTRASSCLEKILSTSMFCNIVMSNNETVIEVLGSAFESISQFISQLESATVIGNLLVFLVKIADWLQGTLAEHSAPLLDCFDQLWSSYPNVHFIRSSLIHVLIHLVYCLRESVSEILDAAIGIIRECVNFEYDGLYVVSGAIIDLWMALLRTVPDECVPQLIEIFSLTSVLVDEGVGLSMYVLDIVRYYIPLPGFEDVAVAALGLVSGLLEALRPIPALYAADIIDRIFVHYASIPEATFFAQNLLASAKTLPCEEPIDALYLSAYLLPTVRLVIEGRVVAPSAVEKYAQIVQTPGREKHALIAVYKLLEKGVELDFDEEDVCEHLSELWENYTIITDEEIISDLSLFDILFQDNQPEHYSDRINEYYSGDFLRCSELTIDDL
ncbi:hypothetical protein PCE1_001883 [Barthelona sp. PCE]